MVGPFSKRNLELVIASFCTLSIMVMLAITAFSGAGCAVTNSLGTNTVDEDDGSDDDDTTTVSSNFEVTVTAPDSSLYTYYLSKNGDKTTGCTAAAGESVTCILDMEELDLFFNGFTLRNDAPSSLCAYRIRRPYYYQIAYFSTSLPTAVAYDVDADTGAVSNVVYTGGTSNPVGSNGYYVNPYTGVATAFTTAGEVADVTCPFDYTRRYSPYGKNCCEGDYTLTVNTISNSVGTAVTSTASWGGSYGNCFRGTAMDTESLSSSGLPTRKIVNVPASGLADEYAVKAPITLDSHLQEQIYAANYFKSSDHGGSGTDQVTKPFALRNYKNSDGYLTAFGFPYYRFDCLDSDQDLVARIDVLVRDWNTNGELAKTAGTGDPDVTGSESSPFTDPTETKNDHCDWKDLETTFPSGSSLYTGFTSVGITSGSTLVCEP